MRRNDRRSFASFTIAAFVLTLLTTSYAQDQNDSEKQMQSQAQQIQAEVEALRGLKFRSPVPVGVQSRKKMEQLIVASTKQEFEKAETRDSERVLKMFGFVPDDFEFGPGLAKFYGSQIGGYYDPKAKRLFLIDSGKKRGPSAKINDGFVIAHELGHALQDQHFDLTKFQALFHQNEDMELALKSLIEGEATIIGIRWLGSKSPAIGDMDSKQFFEFSRKMSERRKPSKKANELSKLPNFIRATAMFPYQAGANFVEQLSKRKGLSAITALFRNPPVSSEQILHPQKFFGPNPDQPRQIFMANIADTLGDGFEELNDNTLGEFQIYLLLEALGAPKKMAANAAAGWGGDRYQSFKIASDDSIGLVWLSVWDSEADAIEFEECYRKFLRKRFAKTDKQLFLKRQGSRCLMIDGLGSNKSFEIANLAWASFDFPIKFNATPALKAKPQLSDFENARRGDPAVMVANGQLIEDEQTGASFHLPSSGWVRAEEDIRELAQFLRQRYQSADGVQDLRFLEIPFEFDAERMPKRLESFIRRGAKDAVKKLQETLTIADRKAIRVDLQGTIPGEKSVSRISVVAVEYGTSTLLFLYRTKPELWEDHSIGFKGLLASMQLDTVPMLPMMQAGERMESTNLVFSIIRPQGWTARPSQASKLIDIRDGKGARLIAHFVAGKRRSTRFYDQSVDFLINSIPSGCEVVGTKFQDFSGYDGLVVDYIAPGKKSKRRSRLILLNFENGRTLKIKMDCPNKRSSDYRKLFINLSAAIEVLNPEAEIPAEKPPSPKRAKKKKPKLY